MWSEEIDKKLRETAEGHEPAYEDKNWDKMELLLNTHLPLEKKRRRFILFWLLPLLLTGAGIFFFLQQIKKPVPEQGTETIQALQNKHDASQPGNDPSLQDKPSSTQKINEQPTSKTNTAIPVIDKQQGPSNTTEIASAGKLPVRAGQRQQSNNKQPAGKKAGTSYREEINVPPVVKNEPAENLTTPVTSNATDNSSNISSTTAVADSLSITETSKNSKAVEPVKAADTVAVTTKISTPQKQSAGGKIDILLSAGPDISGVSVSNPGDWEFQYGVGISYALSKKLRIRTGFYTGHKVYTADSGDYHADYLPPKLQKIDANCTVFEIPLNLIYNFTPSKKHNWFASAGFSSYLMKEETYEYYYLNNWNQMQVYTRTYTNENTHVFSVLGLSGGYQYNFTDRFFIMAEPYVRIPLSGIGHGKVKLNSAGILFSAGFKPFK